MNRYKKLQHNKTGIQSIPRLLINLNESAARDCLSVRPLLPSGTSGNALPAKRGSTYYTFAYKLSVLLNELRTGIQPVPLYCPCTRLSER
jgi:hypothetical protein